MPRIEEGISKVFKNDSSAVSKFMKHAGVAFADNAKLYNCDEKSLVSCLVTCASYNLYPDKRNAYLVPYGRKCTFIIGYMGLIQLIYRSKLVKDVIAEPVYSDDIVTMEDGQLKHTVKNPFSTSRGELVGFYAKARMVNGGEVTAHMTVEEVEAIRNESPGKNSDPWKKHYNEMGKKTVVRRLSKMLPIESDLVDAIQAEDNGHETQKPSFDDAFDDEPIETTFSQSAAEQADF